MDKSLKLYWDLYFETVSNDEMIREHSNPIREFEKELIDGAILDIGCGQSPFILDILKLDKKIFALDNELFQLKHLENRIRNFDSESLKKCTFLQSNFPADNLPDTNYSLIILSNILHFYNIQECIEIGNLIKTISIKGTIIYIKVHSYKHHANDPENPDNNEYFKHFFNRMDLDSVFNKNDFETIYFADVESVNSQNQIEFLEKWLDRFLDNNRIYNPVERLAIKKEYLQNKTEANFVLMLKKK